MTPRRYTLLTVLALGLAGLVWGPLTASRPQVVPSTHAYVSGTFFTRDGMRVFVMNPTGATKRATVYFRDFEGFTVRTSNLSIPARRTRSVNSPCQVCYRNVAIESTSTNLAPSAAYLSVRSNPPAPEVVEDQRISAGGFDRFCLRRC
jgi:hypothetical protein